MDGLFVTFEEVPAGPDRAASWSAVRSTILPEPAPVGAVAVALDGPGGAGTPVPLAPVEQGRYEADDRAAGARRLDGDGHGPAGRACPTPS